MFRSLRVYRVLMLVPVILVALNLAGAVAAAAGPGPLGPCIPGDFGCP